MAVGSVLNPAVKDPYASYASGSVKEDTKETAEKATEKAPAEEGAVYEKTPAWLTLSKT